MNYFKLCKILTLIILINYAPSYSQNTDIFFKAGIGLSKFNKEKINSDGPYYSLKHKRGSSYHLGTGISIPLKKWLAINLSFLLIQFNSKATAPEQQLGELHIDNIILYDMTSKYSQNTKSNYLSIPLSLEFKTKNFSILSGIQVQRLLLENTKGVNSIVNSANQIYRSFESNYSRKDDKLEWGYLFELKIPLFEPTHLRVYYYKGMENVTEENRINRFATNLSQISIGIQININK